jgi:hypothetical protein
MRTLYALLIVAAVTACASVAPVKLQAGDSCYRCHRVIQDTKLAAEIMDQGDRIVTSYPFRTAGCLAKYLKQNPAGTSSTIYVTDYRTGHMIAAGAAWFVPLTLASADGKKIEHDFAAFGSREDANGFRQDVVVKRWAEVLADAVPD